jgi:hypothetical protein
LAPALEIHPRFGSNTGGAISPVIVLMLLLTCVVYQFYILSLSVFRTNSSYNRWDEARKFWGLNINHTRDLNRMATAWYGIQSEWDGTEFMEKANPHKNVPIDPIERQYLLGQVSLMTWAFVRSMKRHLSPLQEDEDDFVSEIKSRLAPAQADAIISATHRPNRALYDLSVAIEKVSSLDYIPRD